MYMMFGREASTPEMVGIDERMVEKQAVVDGDEDWIINLVEALETAWTAVTARTRKNWARMNRGITSYAAELREATGDKTGGGKVRQLRYREYQEGDRFYRRRCPVRTFASAKEKEKYKISMKLQPRFEGPFVVTKRINAVLYEAEFYGKKGRVHAVNMKPESA